MEHRQVTGFLAIAGVRVSTLFVKETEFAEAAFTEFITWIIRIRTRRCTRDAVLRHWIADFLSVAENPIVTIYIADTETWLRVFAGASFKKESSGERLLAA
jgi:hypothetical protein